MTSQESQKPLWTSLEAVQAMNARWGGEGAIPIYSISIDSRTVDNGALFFAIQGDRIDGHEFVKKALDAGASFAVVAQEKAQISGVDPSRLFIVDDVLVALEQLASAARNRLSGQSIAVTGSVGKTGTKEMLRQVFSANGVTHASVASFNNHWGVPLTLARSACDSDFAIFEIGMNHPGEITPLVKLVRPHIVIITTVEPVHLEFFANEQEIARAKAEVFFGVVPGGHAIINLDNRHYHFIKGLADERGVKAISFGENRGADVRLIRAVMDEEGTKVTASVFGKEMTYKLGQPGRHIVMNSLAVAAALAVSGVDLTRGLAELSTMKAGRGRGARLTLAVEGGHFTLVDESYNANPASMRAAIKMLGEVRLEGAGRRITVLGDMLELGDDSATLHEELAAVLEAEKIDLVYACGPQMHRLFNALPPEMQGGYAPTSAGLQNSLTEMVAKDDVIMVKGSLGSQMGCIVETLSAQFDERSSVTPL